MFKDVLDTCLENLTIKKVFEFCNLNSLQASRYFKHSTESTTMTIMAPDRE